MPVRSVSTVGADADELERAASTLRTAADELDAHAGSVTATLRSVAWVGGVATRFGSNWNAGHRPRIATTARYVRDAADRLDRNAAEQRQASLRPNGGHGGTGSGGSGGSSGSVRADSGGADTSGPRRQESAARLERLLGRLGVAHGRVESIVELAERLSEHGEIGPLIDLLTGDAFGAFLAGAGHVVDAGSVIVDAVTDLAEHPDLAFDERIVHALADAAVRFGLDQGMEAAAGWLAGAATTALLPGFGVILAPFVGDIAGAVAAELLDAAVDVIDGATDIVDTIADAAVAAYRDVKAVVGVVADVAVAAVEVVGGAVDLAGDAAGVLVDAGGAVIGTGVDVVGDVAGAFNPFD